MNKGQKKIMIFSKENKFKRDLKYRDRWVEIREAGKMKYVLKYGVLFYGLPVGFVFFIFNYWGTPISNLLPQILISLIVWPLMGFVYGLITWKTNEKMLLKLNQRIVECEGEKEDIAK